MSSTSGLAANKTDKSKAKFKSIDINNVYKGTSVGPPKTAAATRQHGLQSLGKVASRRMPPPAHLPSLKSEQGGTEQTVSIVPTGGSGWGNGGKEEENRVATGTPTSSAQTAPAQSQLSGRPQSQTPSQNRTSSSVEVSSASSGGTQSWSSVTSGPRGQGKLSIAKSKFQEEFPELAAGADDKVIPRKDESKELQYGPGPSLRPQNVASWRDGGGRSITQQTHDEDRSSSPGTGPGSAIQQDVSSDDEDEHVTNAANFHVTQSQHAAAAAMSRMLRPGMIPGPGPRIAGPPGGPMMFGPIMPPFLFHGPRFGPQFAGFPPVPPPYFHPDQRFRGPPIAPRMNFEGPSLDKQPSSVVKPVAERQAIIKDHALRDFDRLAPSDNDNSWAAASDRDVDYSAKLVFSDEEDGPASTNSRHDKKMLSPRDRHSRRDREEYEVAEMGSPRERGNRDVGSDIASDWDRDRERPSPRDRKRPPSVDRENLHETDKQQPLNQYDRMPVDMHWHARLPFPRAMSVMYPHVRPAAPVVGFPHQPFGKYDGDEEADNLKQYDDLPEQDRQFNRTRYRDTDGETKVKTNEDSKRSDQLTMSTRMIKLTSQRAGRKAAEENELVSTSAVSDAELTVTSSTNENKGQSDHDPGTVKPPLAWTTSSQWVATSTASCGSGSRERWTGSGLADNAEGYARGWVKPRVTQSSSEDERGRDRDDDNSRKSEKLSNSRDVSAEKGTESNDRVTDSSTVNVEMRRKLPESQQAQTAYNRSSDVRDRSGGKATDRAERSQRKDVGKDSSKSSAGVDWRDEDDESVEWSQGDDAPYHVRTAGRRDKRRLESRSNCPPPIPLRQSQQNLSTGSRYTPLKRGGVSVNDLKASACPVTMPGDSQSAENKAPQTVSSTSVELESKQGHPDVVSQPGDICELSRTDKVVLDRETVEPSTTDASRPDGDTVPALSRQLTWGDAVEESLKETEQDNENVTDDVKRSKVSTGKSQENAHAKSKDEVVSGKFKQDKQGYRKYDSETVRSDKLLAGNKPSFETSLTNDRSQLDDKPSLERARNDDRMFVSNKFSQETARGDDRPPAKKMKDECSSFYGRKDDGSGRDRSERNRVVGRSRGKAESNRSAAGRPGYGNNNNARQGPARDGMTGYTVANMGEKRGTLTFERSDLHRENDTRKGPVQRAVDHSKRDNMQRRKEDSTVTSNKTKDETDQQSIKECQTSNLVIVAAAAPRTNAWDQPLRLPKSTKPERNENVEKQNSELLVVAASQPVEGTDTCVTKHDMVAGPREGNLSHPDKDYYHHDIRREYRTGRGRRSARRTTGRRHNWTSDATVLMDDESYSQRKRQDLDSCHQFDEGGNQLEDSTSRGDRSQGTKRRPRTGPASSGRNAQRSLRENATFEAPAGHGRDQLFSNSGMQDDANLRQRDHRRRNWRRNATSGAQSYSRYSSGHSRVVSDSVPIANITSRRGARTVSSSTTPHSPKLQSPVDQNSSDFGNEEWETASESSDVLTHHHHLDGNGVKSDDAPQRDGRRDTKKAPLFGPDRANRRVDVMSESSHSHGSEGLSTTRRNGQIGRGNGVAVRNTGRQGTSSSASHKQSTEQSATRTAVSASDVSRTKSKLAESKDETARVTKAEKDKKDAMANIDINNYASVVVIDDQPEVSIDDPSFLYQSNEGFQEVTSRRAQKSRQKAAALEEAKKSQELQMQAAALAKKAEKDAKKRMSVSGGKLPPRLTGRRERKQNPRNQQQQPSAQQLVVDDNSTVGSTADILPKIENWDNEMANNIPAVTSSSVSVTATAQPVRAVGTAATVVLSPTMPIGKWESPPVTAVTPISMAIAESVSDVVCNQSVNASTSTETVTSAVVATIHGPSDIDSQLMVDIMSSEETVAQQLSLESLNPQQSQSTAQMQQPVVASQSQAVEIRLADIGPFITEAPTQATVPSKAVEKTIVKPMPKMDDSRAVIKKPDASSVTSRPARPTYDPIELPSSFAFGKYSKGDESSELKLDFTFDADLAKIASDKPIEVKDAHPPPITMPPGAVLHRSTAVVSASVPDLQSLQSPAADDLNMKIASVKNVWERENHSQSALAQIFEQRIIAAAAQTAAAGGIASDEMKSSPVPQSVQPQQQSPAVIPVQQQTVVQQNVPSYSDYTSYVDAVSTGVVVGAADNLPIHHQGPVDVGCIDGSSGASGGTVLDQNVTGPLVYIDAVPSYATSSKEARNLLGEQTNVCKVRPQLQASSSPPSLAHMRIGSSVSGLSANTAQLMYAATGQSYQYAVGALTQDTAGIGLQYGGQPAYGYGMTQQPTQTAMLAPVAQSNLFLQPATLQQSDLYSASAYRNPFGPAAAAQPNTIMVSSATSTLMSPAIKPPSQHIYLASGNQKTNPMPAAAVQFGQLVGQANAQSQLCVQYETAGAGQPGLATSPVAQAADPLLAAGQPSQIIGSQLVQQRTAMQALQPATNYFSQTPLQQTGFYQAQQAAAGSALQGSYQQLAAQSFSLSAFNHQTPAVTVAVQPVHSQLKLSAPPFKPASQQVQLKGLTSSSSATYTPSQQSVAGYLHQQLYGSLQQQQQPTVQAVGNNAPSAGTQQQYHQYYTQSQQPQATPVTQPQFYSAQQQPQHLSEQLQLLQQNTGSAAAGIGGSNNHLACPNTSSGTIGTTGQGNTNWQRTSSVSASGTSPASTHYQRQQSTGTSYGTLQQPQPDQSKLSVAGSVGKSAAPQHQSQRPYGLSSSNVSMQARGGSDPSAQVLRELQAQERRKALQQVQSFLNPQNKPPAKTLSAPTMGKGNKDSNEEGRTAGSTKPVDASRKAGEDK